MRPRPEYTTGECAKLLGCSVQTVIREIDRGELEGYRVPRSGFRRVYHEDLIEYMRLRELPPYDAEWHHLADKVSPFIHARKFAWVHDKREWYTTGMVADIWGTCPATVAKWCDTGLLHGYRVPGGVERRIRKGDLIEFCLHHPGPFRDRIL